MSDNPIIVQNQASSNELLKGTVKGPIVVPYRLDNKSNAANAALGINASVYKVRMVANGKTFNMLLPPSIESKHPGRSNPLQLPGLQIKAGMSISKLKIPGFFPIYQHLGVESLTISMSGMFTGYDGTDSLSTASNWEGWENIDIKEGQDAYASANEFYDFAVKSKSLIEVTIYTSDGTFIPKNTASTTFRDSSSNIKFKGYVKEIEQVYIRQDRVYYMIRFEIIDLGTNICKGLKDSKKVDKLINEAAVGKGTINPVLTPEDITYATPTDLENAKILIDKINNKEKLTLKDLDTVNSIYLKAKLTLYADSKKQDVSSLYMSIINQTPTTITKSEVIENKKRQQFLLDEYTTLISVVCGKLNRDCEDKFTLVNTNQKIIDSVITAERISLEPQSIQPVKDKIIPKVTQPVEQRDQSQVVISNNSYSKEFTNKYITNQRVLVNSDQANRDFRVNPPFDSSVYVSYIGNANRENNVYPVLQIRSVKTGLDIGSYVATPYNSNRVTLERR